MSGTPIPIRHLLFSLAAGAASVIASHAAASAGSPVLPLSAGSPEWVLEPAFASDRRDGATPPSRRVPPRAVRRPPGPDPEDHVGAANAAARIQPAGTGFDNAIQRYFYSEGALFQVYASPGQVTDIVLQEGEQLVGPGPVAAGDTARWMIADTLSGAGAAQKVHILVKPLRPDITTNLVINTDRRTYHIELRATPEVYMASVSWSYPQDGLIALRGAQGNEARAAAVDTGIVLHNLSFDYRISGDRPAWRPVRVFDDGRRTIIEFPPEISTSEMPPFFVIGQDGETELVNYRVEGRFLVVDRLFREAQLRLGSGRRQVRVDITNNAATGS